MNNDFIIKILERAKEHPLDDFIDMRHCVLTISGRKRELMFILGSYINDAGLQRIEVVYADNHETVYKGMVDSDAELEKVILFVICKEGR